MKRKRGRRTKNDVEKYSDGGKGRIQKSERGIYKKEYIT
jgi:hypothetical protein